MWLCVFFSTCFCIFHLTLFLWDPSFFFLASVTLDSFALTVPLPPPPLWLGPPPALVLFPGSYNWQPSLLTAWHLPVHSSPHLASAKLLYSPEIQAYLSKTLLDTCNSTTCKYRRLHPSKSELVIFALDLQFLLLFFNLNKGTPSIVWSALLNLVILKSECSLLFTTT